MGGLTARGLAFGALGVVVAAASWIGLRHVPLERERLSRERGEHVAWVAGHVAGEVSDWTRSVANEARVVAAFPTTRRILRSHAGARSEDAEHLGRVLASIRAARGQDGIWIFDGSDAVAGSDGSGAGPAGAVTAAAEAALATGCHAVRTLGDTASGVTAVVAVPAPEGGPGDDGAEAVGAVVVAVREDAALDRIMKSHVGRQAGVRCWLAGVGGAAPDDVVPQGIAATAWDEAISGRVRRAVAEGRQEIIFPGPGHSLAVAVQPVGGTPWTVVASGDVDFVLTPLRELMRGTLVLVGAIVLGAAGVAWGIIRTRAAAARSEIARRDVRFAGLVDQIGDVMFIMGADGTLLDVAGQTEAMYGRRPEEFRGRHASMLRPADLRADVAETISRTTTSPETIYETVHVRADGTTFPVECSTRLLSPDGDERVIAIVRDIGRRKREQAEIVRVNRLLRTLSEVNQLICRETDRRRLLDAACVAIAEHGGFRAAWIGFADRTAGTIEPAAAGGAAVEYLKDVRIRCDDTPAGRGPAGVCVRMGRPDVVHDVLSEDRVAGFRDAAAVHGIRSIAAAPLAPAGGDVRGVLVVCGAEPGACGGEMLEIVTQVAGDIAFALHVIDERERVEEQRREADDALRRSERQARDRARDLETLLDTVPVGVWISRDPECRTATGNRAMHELIGLPAGADLGLAAFGGPAPVMVEVLHGSLRAGPGEFPPLVAARTDARVGPVFEEMRFRDGRRIHTVGHAAPLHGDDGRVIGAVGALVDVTEMVAARRELEILRRAIDQSPASVVITDATGAIEYVNRRFTDVTGYTAEEARGKNPRILKSGETSPETHAQLWAKITSGHEWRGWLHNRTRDGRTFTEFAVISPIVDPAGRITHYLAVKEDVTDRLATRAELAEAQKALLQAQKLEAVGRLAGGVAHDFNNMLAIVMGYTELALGAMRADDPSRAQLEQVADAAERASQLTRQLLAFSRRQVIEPRILDLNVVVGGLAKLLRRLIGEDIDLVVVLAPDLGRVRADPGQIEQILVNLAVNSRDAMPHGGRLLIATANDDPPVSDSIEPGVPPGRCVRMSVSDTGSGIAPEIRDRIFEPFFTTKPTGKGTGLGLATVYGIVRQSGGTIRLESEVGMGTAFHIYLPCVEGAVDADADGVPELPDAAAACTILLVEDDVHVRRLATRMVESLGHRVIAADGPEEAIRIAAVRTDRIDLLLTDVVMPGMDGHQLAQRLAPRIRGGRVLFMSGYLEGDLAHSAELPAGTHLMHKPFTLDVLTRKIREALDAPAAGEAG